MKTQAILDSAKAHGLVVTECPGERASNALTRNPHGQWVPIMETVYKVRGHIGLHTIDRVGQIISETKGKIL